MLIEPALLMAHSRLTQSGNGSQPAACPNPPTSGQKWWAALLLTMLFLVLSSGGLVALFSGCMDYMGMPTWLGGQSGLLLIQALLFLLIVRLLLW